MKPMWGPPLNSDTGTILEGPAQSCAVHVRVEAARQAYYNTAAYGARLRLRMGCEDLNEAGNAGDGAAHKQDLDGGKQHGQHVQLLAAQLHLCQKP